jgi:putative acetyltransferase
MADILIRPIQPIDDAAMANIIRRTMEEFGVNWPGTVYTDDTTDHLFWLFASAPKSCYFVAEVDGKLVGGGGIYPTNALPEGTCELVKMWLLPDARGRGLGRDMISRCLLVAKEKGFTQVYLETMPELKRAISVYEKFGFTFLEAPMGNSGHTSCAVWMLKKL